MPLLNGLMVMLGALGAVTATWPAELLLASIGWRELFGLFAALTAVCAIMVHIVVPEAAPTRSKAVSVGLKKVYADPRFWRLAPLSASCIGTAWALQGLWAAQWLADVDGLDRAGVVQHLFIMAVALSVGAIGLGIAADRLRRRGVGPEVLLGLVATVFIAIQLALILRLPLPSYMLWSGVAATGAATVLSYAILAEYFPKELTGRANGALNLFHIAAAFAVQYATGLVVQQWTPGRRTLSRSGLSDRLRSQCCVPDRGMDLVRDAARFPATTGNLASRGHPKSVAGRRRSYAPDNAALADRVRAAFEPRWPCPQPRILWGQILVVLAIVLVTTWAATQWVAWKLGYQPQLGQPWFEIAAGIPVYLPPAFFWWWYAYDAYAPDVFVEGAYIAASGGFISIAVAIGMSVWRAREAKTAATYGSARWATPSGDSCRRPHRARWRRARPVRAQTIFAMMDRNMCCASRRPDRARASAWSCRRC